MEMASQVVGQHIEHHYSQQSQKTEQMMHSKLRTRRHLSLENYLAFCHSHHFASFNVDELNTIVSIHGFKKVDKRKQSEEAVRAIEPINPVRSTLQDNISASFNATITLSEAIKDLKTLNWQECSITSIKSINEQNNMITSDLPSMKVAKAQPLKTKRKKATKKTATKEPEIAASMSCSSSGPSSNSSCSRNHSSIVLASPTKRDASKGPRRPMIKKRKKANVNEMA